MHVIVNLKTIQKEVEDLLFSLRYITKDHQATPLTPEDYTVLNDKLITVRSQITAYFENQPKPSSDFEKDLQQNIINPVISSQKENHKLIAQLEIFNSSLQTLLSNNLGNISDEQFIVQAISTALHISNESLKALELEK